MRIGFVWPGYQENLGGGFTFTKDVLAAVFRADPPPDWDLCLVSLSDGAMPQGVNADKHFVLDQVPVSTGKLHKLFNRSSVAPRPVALVKGKAINELLDVLVFPCPGFLADADLPQVSTIWDLAHRHATVFPEISHRAQRRQREEYFREMFNIVDKVVVGSVRGSFELQTYYGIDPANIWRIPHPLPCDASVRDGEYPSLSYAERENIAVYPAQLWAHKNHLTLIEAWAKLVRLMPAPPKLVFTGKDYGNKAYLQTQVKLHNLGNHIEFRGFVPRAELLQLYSSAKVLVYPSLFGPENLPPLEAMSFGCPVLVSDYSGAREQFGDAAIYVKPLDPQAWCDAVQRLLTAPRQAAELIKKGRERASSFTVEDFVDELFSHLRELVSVRRLWRQAGN
jgi:glycosyltransferase involved in cell wall biosynthesis